MTERKRLEFELWAGRRIRISWILIWTLVFFVASAFIFSAIEFGQAAPEAPATKAEVNCLRSLVEALDAARRDTGSEPPDDPCAPEPSTQGGAREPLGADGGERD